MTKQLETAGTREGGIWVNGDVDTVMQGGKAYAEGRVVPAPGDGLFYILASTPNGLGGVAYVTGISNGAEHCSCYDYMNKRRFKHQPCKHMWAVLAYRLEAIAQGESEDTEGEGDGVPS